MITPEQLQPLLGGGRFGAVIHSASVVPSTQDAARAAAQAGAAEGTLYLAERQTLGRGRHGHGWDSPPGAGLYASIILRPRMALAQMLPLTLAFGLAVADAVMEACGVEPTLRWPNDLMLGGKKFCGLLLEAGAVAGGEPLVSFAVLGIGLNVAHRPFPPELAAIATAIEEHTPGPIPRLQLCAALLRHLEMRYAAFAAGAVLREFERRCPGVRDQAVTIGGTPGGITAGLDAAGFLQVRRPDGSITLVMNGDVRPVL